MRKASLLLLVMLALAASAAAQNKISSAAQCGKSDKEYSIDVGDRAGHTFAISQGKCAFTKGEVEGIQIKEGKYTGFVETSGDAARGRYTGVVTMGNGDMVYERGEFTQILKGGAVQTEEGKWTWSSGTGKFKGFTAKGTYKLKASPDGTSAVEGEGEYTQPAAKK